MGLVTFESVSLRDQVIAEVTQALSALNWSVQTLRAADLNPRQFITSVTASGANCLFVLDADHLLFGSDGEISPFWINFERERLVEHPGVQVWWMRPAGAILLGQQLPDLNRFFLFRERLQGADPVEARGPWEMGIAEPRPSGPPAPSLARLLFDQALQAADAGAEPARVWLELGSPAIEAFLNSRDTQGAGAVLSELTSRIGPPTALLERGVTDDAQASDLARAIMNQGNALQSLGRLEEAVAAFDKAIRILRRLVEQEGRTELSNPLAAAIMNQGVALASLGRLEAAVSAYEEAISIRRGLVEEEGRAELANDLATALYNLAIAREGHPQALVAAREARQIWERLVGEGWAHLAANLEKARKLELQLTGGPS